MFKRNAAHLQTEMFGLLNSLPDTLQTEAKKSEEYCFYQIIFRNIQETLSNRSIQKKKSAECAGQYYVSRAHVANVQSMDL